jgi:hypothetical protein
MNLGSKEWCVIITLLPNFKLKDMISEETLDSVRIGILTDEELDEAISHYEVLEKDLKCHGELYHLVWRDVYFELMRLEGYKKSRKSRI